MSTKVHTTGIQPMQTPVAPGAAGEAALSPEAKALALGKGAPVAPMNGSGVPLPTGQGDGAKKANYDVQISPGAKQRADEYQKALSIAKGTPDVREDRVAAIKKQIADGSYQVDPGKIADGMLREAVKDHLATDL